LARRRSIPRSNPANFIFTLFDMALMLHWRPVNRQTPLSQQEARHGWFFV
jgi:hypothetical protein